MTIISSPRGGFVEKIDLSDDDRQELLYEDVPLERKLMAISRLALEALYSEHVVPDSEMARRLSQTLEENQRLRLAIRRERDEHAEVVRAKDREVRELRNKVLDLEDAIQNPRRRQSELDHLMRARPRVRG